MTNDIDYKISVMDAYRNGERIEFRLLGSGDWNCVTNINITWNWDAIDYRIAKPEPKKVKFEAWIIASGALVWYDMSKVQTWSSEFIRVPSEDKEIELP